MSRVTTTPQARCVVGSRALSATLVLLCALALVSCQSSAGTPTAGSRAATSARTPEPAGSTSSSFGNPTIPATPNVAQHASPIPQDTYDLTYRVVASFPHDPNAFTEGLMFYDGALYEGTGETGTSTLRKVELETGKVLQSQALADQYFGEGITIFDGHVYQLTYDSHIGFVYDLKTFQQLDTFTYTTQGWGLTNDGAQLIMSDGTSALSIRDPKTFNEVKRITVTDRLGPVMGLNELEYIDGSVYANVWPSDRIVRIDPQTGRVTASIDLGGLRRTLSGPARNGNVLNGIAYDPETGRLFVTGKYWPNLFEIALVPKT